MHTFKYVTPSDSDARDPEKMELLGLVDRVLILQSSLFTDDKDDIYDVYSLMRMDEPELRIALDKLRDLGAAPAPAAPAKRSKRPVEYVDPALPDHPTWRPPHARPQLPAWAKEKVEKGPRLVTRKLAPEDRPQRFKAQLWHKGYTVHLGMYNSPEARDEAVEQAKARRAIGLPIKGA